MTVSSIVDENYEWFKDNLSELVKKYNGLYIIIKDKQVKEACATFDEAWEQASQTEKAGEYLIQLCALDETGEVAMPTFFNELCRCGSGRNKV